MPETLIRASLASYARYWREAFRLPTMNLESVARRFDENVDGVEHLDAALKRGRGVIMALPHSGNWDVAGVWLVQKNGTFTTVAERLKPESLYRRFIDYRESLGFEVLPLTGGDRPAYEVLVERVRDNRIVCLMAERDLTRSGVPVDLFGEPTRMPAGPAKLAIETGAALLPCHVWFEGDGWGLDIGRRLIARVRTSVSSPRRWLTVSARTSPGTRRLAHAAAPMAGRSVRRTSGQTRLGVRGLMRIGMVCPYSLDVPGGFSHVLQLAEVMRARGHHVSVLAPASAEAHAQLPDFVVSGGKAVPIPYNGSVARLRFGPATHRKVKRWLTEGDFDVLHLHDPTPQVCRCWL